jgi:hypothetical protein
MMEAGLFSGVWKEIMLFIQLEPELNEVLESVAKKMGRIKSSVARETIRQYSKIVRTTRWPLLQSETLGPTLASTS